jgi:hypothetical protein
MHVSLLTLWQEEISMMLPDAAAEERVSTEGIYHYSTIFRY